MNFSLTLGFNFYSINQTTLTTYNKNEFILMIRSSTKNEIPSIIKSLF